MDTLVTFLIFSAVAAAIFFFARPRNEVPREAKVNKKSLEYQKGYLEGFKDARQIAFGKLPWED